MLILLSLAGFGLVRSADSAGPPSRAQVAHEVAASLRCPTCQGLSVAESNSPLAQSMRQIIDQQVAQHRSPQQIRGYFVERYGDWILLAPPADRLGWVVWAAPAVAVAVGLVVASRLLGRRRLPRTVRWVSAAALFAAASGVLVWSNLGERGAGGLPTGNVPAAAGSGAMGRSAAPTGAAPGSPAPTDAAADLRAMEAAVARQPDNASARLSLASAALRVGRLEVVRAQAEAVLQRDPDNVDALLLRGLSPLSRTDPQALTAMRKFLQLAPPDHPGVPVARAVTEGVS